MAKTRKGKALENSFNIMKGEGYKATKCVSDTEKAIDNFARSLAGLELNTVKPKTELAKLFNDMGQFIKNNGTDFKSAIKDGYLNFKLSSTLAWTVSSMSVADGYVMFNTTDLPFGMLDLPSSTESALEKLIVPDGFDIVNWSDIANQNKRFIAITSISSNDTVTDGYLNIQLSLADLGIESTATSTEKINALKTYLNLNNISVKIKLAEGTVKSFLLDRIYTLTEDTDTSTDDYAVVQVYDDTLPLPMENSSFGKEDIYSEDFVVCKTKSMLTAHDKSLYFTYYNNKKLLSISVKKSLLTDSSATSIATYLKEVSPRIYYLV